MSQIRVTPSGIMDKDTDVSYVNQGNYTDANNIRHRQTDGGNFAGVMPIKGNLNKLTEVNGSSSTSLPTYVAGEKKYRVTINISDLISGELANHSGKIYAYFEPPLGLLPSDVGTATGSYSSTSIATCVTDVKTAITNAVTGIGWGTFGLTLGTATISGNYASFDVTWSGYDFVLKIENTIGTYAEFALIQEYSTAVGDGTFSVIGSQQLNDDVFLFLAGSHLNGEISVFSEIGVLYSTDSDATFKYKTLIRSKKLGFSPYKRIQCEIEKLGSQINLYFTDNLNPPKVFYLDESLKRTENGLLKNGVAGATSGRYELNTIDVETNLSLQNPSSYISNVTVIEGGGSLTCGNKRYTGRFLTSDFTRTDFFYPSNPVNIFRESLYEPTKITGNLSDVISNKSVEVTIENIVPGIYSYFELVVIEYAGETFTSKIVQRFSLKDTDTKLTIRHTEQGQENILLSNSEVLAITQKFTTCQTLKIFDNRMTLSNLAEQIDLNLNAWAQTFKHEIKRKQIPYIGKVDSLSDENINYTLNEYINPDNVLNNTSYMFNDTYRFGVQVQWKSTGKWSLPYWVDDIIINTSSSNIINGSTRRIAPSFTNGSLTESIADGNDVYIYYVNFSNIDLDYLVNGVPLRTLIKSIRFTRAERIPEVLATGMFSMGVKFHRPSFNWDPLVGITQTTPTYTDPNIVPFFPSDTAYHNASFPASYAYLNAHVTEDRDDWNLTTQDNSRYVFFYSADYYFNESGTNYKFDDNKDKLKILGVPGTVNRFHGTYGNAEFHSQFLEFDGNIGTPTNNTYKEFDPSHHVYLNSGNNAMLDGEKVFAGAPYNINYTFDERDERSTDGLLTDDYVHLPPARNKYTRSAHVFKLPSTLFSDTEWAASGRNSASLGLFYGQIFRDLGGNKKYPINKELTVYQSTGHIRNLVDGEGGVISQDVFGGDVFNQKTFMLLRMGEKTTNNVTGLGVVLGMYSQNVYNTQMFNYDEWDDTETGSGFAFPQYLDRRNGKTLTEGMWSYAQQWLGVSNNNKYSTAYDFKDGTMIERGYDSTDVYSGKKPASIAWSAKKITGSLKDNYRIFQPSSFSDLDVTLGDIATHEIINNNFYTFQEKSVQRQYFRDPSAISSENGSDIVIGSGSILVSRGQEITNTGTSKKWSLVKGKTIGGKETVYWFNDRLQKMMRFGEDGSRVISDKGMLSYMLNNAKYNIATPEHLRGLGIHGVWNDRYSELIMTFKYNDGVSNKAFTLVYDEIKNGFICFHTYFPNIYVPYNNGFFSVDPANINKLYLHDSGSESTFYGTAQDANIEMVMNYEPNMSKNFEALQIVSEQKPFAANFTTKNHISFLVQGDFDLREDLYYSTIKNDSTGTGVNSNNTSRLWGRWIKIKVNLKSTTVGQKLINAIVKFRLMPRLYNQ